MELEESIKNIEKNFDYLNNTLKNLQKQKEDLVKKINVEKSNVDIDGLKSFVSKPYIVNPVGKERYEVIVPKFLDFQVGRLDRVINNYNVFIVDKYTKWMTGIPDFLKDEIEMDDKTRFTINNDLLTYNPEEKEIIESNPELKKHVSNIEKDKATIKRGHEIELIAEIIEHGDLPFIPKPVEKKDIRPTELSDSFEIREYQEQGLQRFLQKGHVCFCWMTGAGKSFPSIKILDMLKYDSSNKKAVVCYGKATKQQWKEYFKQYAPRLLDEVEIVTYHSLEKLKGEYIIIVFDECHSLPADTFVKGATIPTKYRIGLSATPYREDGRQNYIFALTGEPIGLNWKQTLDILNKKYHKIKIHIVKNQSEKIKRIKKQLDDRQTLIYSDSISFGNRIANSLNLVFVSGQDNKQLKKIRENKQVVVSRIADHGISLKKLEVLHEADFLFGSRRQQLQRTGRLLHGEGKEHHIYFTMGEFNKYQKRLYSLVEKGFKLEFVDGKKHDITIPEKYKQQIHINRNIGDKIKTESFKSEPSKLVGRNKVIDFLKNDVIKEILKERMNKVDGVASEKIWDLILLFAQNEKGYTHKEVSELTGMSSWSVGTATKPFRDIEPNILVETDKKGCYRFNVNKIQEIIESHKKRKDMENELSLLKKAILG